MAGAQDPLPYVRRFPDADILMSSDHLARTGDDDDLEDYERCEGCQWGLGFRL